VYLKNQGTKTPTIWMIYRMSVEAVHIATSRTKQKIKRKDLHKYLLWPYPHPITAAFRAAQNAATTRQQRRIKLIDSYTASRKGPAAGTLKNPRRWNHSASREEEQ
jgi:hypothetical protein